MGDVKYLQDKSHNLVKSVLSVKLYKLPPLSHITVLRIITSECTTLWGKREQVACILAIEERMMYQTLLSVSEVTVVVGSCGGTLLAPV